MGNAVLDRILAPGFIEHVEAMGKIVAHELHQLMQKFPNYITEVRGKGLIAGIRITPPVRDFVARLRNHKLLTVAASDNVLRLLPPLIVNEDEIREAIGIIAEAFAEFDAEQASRRAIAQRQAPFRFFRTADYDCETFSRSQGFFLRATAFHSRFCP
ncbi:aminotransferase class III-fold pyridoxal phosphate-dependent enzyme [Pelagibacterium sp.]|uniref:aminotransferase class III-fold pyridoxal phosphate-dependent enzyme n=1 Tax=Pelagibacterium sp. TaxID=1967288 RepID=UPI003BACB532